MSRVAAIDCGTNSLRMLVADVDRAAGTLLDVERQMEIVRLGQGIDRTGRIAPEALERTLVVDRAVRRALPRARRPGGAVRGDVRLAGR